LQTTGTDNASGVWTYKLGQYTYWKDGKVKTETAYNGVQTNYGYDGRGQIRATDTYRASTTPVQRYSYRTYTRDERDRILAWSKSNSPTYNVLENGRGDRYGYDYEGQLTAASYEALTPAGTPTGAKRTESFVYDALGNRKGSNVVAGRGAVTFYRRDNGLNQYASWTPSIIYYDDNYPGWAGGWPGNGVMMAEGYITASYNALNQPVAIWSPAYIGSSDYMWFGYDPLGRCVKRWVGPSSTATTMTYFYYDGWNLIQEGTGAVAAERIYLQGNQVDRIVCHYNYAHTRWRYHHYDARGHCILVTDPNGALIEQYEYDAFGRPYFYNASNEWLSDTGYSAFGNRFLFTGREWLSDLKLYDYRNRLYQPELGRFLQPDPKQFEAGDYNLYRYCHNDPINRIDPFGMEDIKLELKKTGDRNQHVNEIIGEKGNRLSGKTEASFKVHPGEKQQDGSTKVTGEMKVDVKYADSAGPKTKAETAKLEPEHAKPFDKFFDRAQKTVDALNRGKFDSAAAAEKAMEGSLRGKFREAEAESRRLDRPRWMGGEHQLPFRYDQ
jgi:RHS repeat-associated protein